jgi:hypothetical protein
VLRIGREVRAIEKAGGAKNQNGRRNEEHICCFGVGGFVIGIGLRERRADGNGEPGH